MVTHDPFFWFTLLFGMFLLIQLVAGAIFVVPALRTYRKFTKQRRQYASPTYVKSTLRERLQQHK